MGLLGTSESVARERIECQARPQPDDTDLSPSYCPGLSRTNEESQVAVRVTGNDGGAFADKGE